MNGLTDYLAAQFAKLQGLRALAGRGDPDRHRMSWVHPGAKNRSPVKNSTDGATLRMIRAAHGVGRPPNPFYIDTKGVEPLLAITEPNGELLGFTFYSDQPITPPEAQFAIATPERCQAAVVKFGSQRKAAAALGISLGKLQRELRKAQPALAHAAE